MSFREIRLFVESMRLLGYSQTISVDSFRNPNVELVADCLYWLIKRYEPSADLVFNIEMESDRVTFFKQACEIALMKARIKMSIKKLYRSDGHAVQELLKLANVLKKAMKATEQDDSDFSGLQQIVAQKSFQDAKTMQQLCSDLTNDGSNLFFLVEEEIRERGERQRVLSRATEVGEFERRLRELLSSVGQQVSQLQQNITNMSADEANLEQKIESKKTQLERTQKRHKSLMSVRPAFIEEYDKHEAELQSQFVQYLEQYRNLEFLEYKLAKYNEKEDAILAEQETKLKVMRERLRKEELAALHSDTKISSSNRTGPPPPAMMGQPPMVRSAAGEGSSESSGSEESEEEKERGPERSRSPGTGARPNISPGVEFSPERHRGGDPDESNGDDITTDDSRGRGGHQPEAVQQSRGGAHFADEDEHMKRAEAVASSPEFGAALGSSVGDDAASSSSDDDDSSELNTSDISTDSDDSGSGAGTDDSDDSDI